MKKFNSRSDEGIFLGYSSTSKAYREYNKRTKKVMETVNVVIDEASEFGSEKISEEIPKENLPPEPKDVQEIDDQEPASPISPSTPSVVEGSADIPACSLSSAGDRSNIILGVPRLNHKEQGKFKDNIIK